MPHALHNLTPRIALLALGPAIGFALAVMAGESETAQLLAGAGCLILGGVLASPLPARLRALRAEAQEARQRAAEALAAHASMARRRMAMATHTEDFASVISGALGLMEAATARLQDAAGVHRETLSLRGEVDGFLRTLRDEVGSDRRRFERYDAHGTVVQLRLPEGPEHDAVLQDISLSGCACRTEWLPVVGTEVELHLPGADGAVTARVARSANGVLGLVFRPELETLARLSPLLGALGLAEEAA